MGPSGTTSSAKAVVEFARKQSSILEGFSSAGREGGVDLLNLFVGLKGKGASSSPSSYLRMMGALSNILSPS